MIFVSLLYYLSCFAFAAAFLFFQVIFISKTLKNFNGKYRSGFGEAYDWVSFVFKFISHAQNFLKDNIFTKVTAIFSFNKKKQAGFLDSLFKEEKIPFFVSLSRFFGFVFSIIVHFSVLLCICPSIIYQVIGFFFGGNIVGSSLLLSETNSIFETAPYLRIDGVSTPFLLLTTLIFPLCFSTLYKKNSYDFRVIY